MHDIQTELKIHDSYGVTTHDIDESSPHYTLPTFLAHVCGGIPRLQSTVPAPLSFAPLYFFFL